MKRYQIILAASIIHLGILGFTTQQNTFGQSGWRIKEPFQNAWGLNPLFHLEMISDSQFVFFNGSDSRTGIPSGGTGSNIWWFDLDGFERFRWDGGVPGAISAIDSKNSSLYSVGWTSDQPYPTMWMKQDLNTGFLKKTVSINTDPMLDLYVDSHENCFISLGSSTASGVNYLSGGLCKVDSSGNPLWAFVFRDTLCYVPQSAEPNTIAKFLDSRLVWLGRNPAISMLPFFPCNAPAPYNLVVLADTNGTILSSYQFPDYISNAIVWTDIIHIGNSYFVSGYYHAFGFPFKSILLKINSNGVPIWIREYIGQGDNRFNSMAIQNGNLIVAGGQYSTYSSSWDPLILRLDSTGNILSTWNIYTPFSSTEEQFNDVIITNHGDIVATAEAWQGRNVFKLDGNFQYPCSTVQNSFIYYQSTIVATPKFMQPSTGIPPSLSKFPGQFTILQQPIVLCYDSQCATNSSLMMNGNQFCIGDTIVLNCLSPSNCTYSWRANGSQIGNLASIVIPVTSSSPISVSCIVTHGACIDTLFANISVSPTSNANFIAHVSGLQVQFQAQDTTSAIWHWDFGDGGISTTSHSPAHTYAVPGSYIVCFTLTASGHCPNMICDTILVTGSSGFDLGIHDGIKVTASHQLLRISGLSPFRSEIELDLSDIFGRRLIHQQVNPNGGDVYVWPISLASGIYLLSIQSEYGTTMHRTRYVE